VIIALSCSASADAAARSSWSPVVRLSLASSSAPRIATTVASSCREVSRSFSTNMLSRLRKPKPVA
jgi:hypothetical protein